MNGCQCFYLFANAMLNPGSAQRAQIRAGCGSMVDHCLACVRPWVLCPILEVKANQREERRQSLKSDNLDFALLSLTFPITNRS